jgi:hypothetical protein
MIPAYSQDPKHVPLTNLENYVVARDMYYVNNFIGFYWYYNDEENVTRSSDYEDFIKLCIDQERSALATADQPNMKKKYQERLDRCLEDLKQGMPFRISSNSSLAQSFKGVTKLFEIQMIELQNGDNN